MSNYLYLGGTRATVLKENEAQLQNGKVSWRIVALKVISYVLLFPLTLTLLAINQILRSQYNFVVISNKQPRQVPIIVELKKQSSTINPSKLPTKEQIKIDLPTEKPLVKSQGLSVGLEQRKIKPISTYLSHPEFFKELSKIDNTIPKHQIQNTGLTEILQEFTFGSQEYLQTNKKELNQLLNELVIEAKKGNLDAHQALTLPNNPGIKIEAHQTNAGFPQNTPLDLLVKMKNLEGVNIILSALDKESLLRTNLRGNTALHIAIITGQMQIASAIVNRANELKVLDDLLNISNKINNKPQDLLSLVLSTANNFKAYFDVAAELLGGEEFNKAVIGKENASESLFGFRNKLLDDLNKIKEKKLALVDLKLKPNLKLLFLKSEQFKEKLTFFDSYYLKPQQIARELFQNIPKNLELAELADFIFKECNPKRILSLLGALLIAQPLFTLSPYDKIRRAIAEDERHSLTNTLLFEKLKEHDLDKDEEKIADCYDLAYRLNHPYIYQESQISVPLSDYNLNFLWVNLNPQDRIQDVAQNIFKDGLDLSENASCIKDPNSLHAF